MTTRKATTKRPAKGKADDERDAFALHFAEVLRIARTADFITSRFYNALFDAWADAYANDTGFYESEEFIRLSLAYSAEEGGAE